jgi:hypothetical protein
MEQPLKDALKKKMKVRNFAFSLMKEHCPSGQGWGYKVVEEVTITKICWIDNKILYVSEHLITMNKVEEIQKGITIELAKHIPILAKKLIESKHKEVYIGELVFEKRSIDEDTLQRVVITRPDNNMKTVVRIKGEVTDEIRQMWREKIASSLRLESKKLKVEGLPYDGEAEAVEPEDFEIDLLPIEPKKEEVVVPVAEKNILSDIDNLASQLDTL